MNEEKARAVLGDLVRDNGDLGIYKHHYISYRPREADIVLDGVFTADELEAIVWWMRNK